MSVLDAAYATVHCDGAEETTVIAERMGLGKQVLLNKVNVNNTTHHLTLLETVKLMQVTNDIRILNALAADFGGIYVPRPDALHESADQLIGDISNMSLKFGTLIQEVAKDIADSKITSNEMKNIEKQANDLRVALEVLLAHIRGLHKQNSPTRTLARNKQAHTTSV